MNKKPILLIHPNDKTTSALNRIKNHLLTNFRELIHHFNIYPNDKSHQDCLDRIKNHPSTGTIIFLGHGRTDKLFGSRGRYFSSIDFVSPEVIIDSPEEFYINENFINQDNIDVFTGKKVFCLACNSNKKVSEYAIEKGATTFLGFGNIPTSIGEFKDAGYRVSNYTVSRMKCEVNYIIKKGLLLGLANNKSFEELMNYIKLITDQRITDIIVNEKSFRERYILTDHLHFFKREIRISGDRRTKLLS